MDKKAEEKIFERNKELQRVKEKTTRSEKEIDRVLEITHVGSWYLDIATNKVAWSKELCKMYGVDPTLSAPPLTEQQKLFTPKSWESLSIELAKTIKTGIPYELELKTIRENGTNGWMRVRGETVTDKDHKTIGLWCAAQDISARKQLELDLILAQERLEDFFNLSPSLIVVTNIDGKIFKINKSCTTILGYTEKEILNIGLWSLVHPDDLKENNKAVERQLKSGKIFNFINRYKNKDGSYRTLEWHTTVVKDGSAYAYAYDVTKQNKATAQLLFQNEEKYAAELALTNKKLAFQIEEKDKRANELSIAYDTISAYKYALDESSIVAITDQKGIIHTVNNNFCNISKYSREELIGQDHRIISSGCHSKEFIKELWSTIANGKVWKGELKNKAKDGTIYWVDTIIVPFLDRERKPYQYIAIRTEITDRKRTDEQLKSVNKELDAFSYSVSHDLRAPLRAINGYAKILEEDYDTVLDSEGKRLLDVVRANSIKMGVLIDDLLTFSRLGRRKITKLSVDMNKLVETYLAEINHSATLGTEIKFNNLLPAIGDDNLLQHVITNLLSNAIKYSSKKENPLIEIKSEQKNGELIYSISDNGVGFDMNYADKLFGVFQRLHADDEFSGNGVGLAIVQRIIQKHDGKVWAEGKEGQGATFFFSMPDIKKTKTHITSNRIDDGK
jgi:PAS domain S-box-containing protein